MEKQGRTYGVVVAAVLVAVACAGGRVFAQTPVPSSLSTTPGVHIRSYDGQPHKSAEYYAELRKVVLREFHVAADTTPINLVFITKELREALNSANPGRFASADWCGAFVIPTLILIVGTDEGDDTFMHEYMHSLQVRHLIFADIPRAVVHDVISQNEGLLLGSDSYLEFLKTRRSPSP